MKQEEKIEQQVYNISRDDLKDIDTPKILTGYFRVREGKGDEVTTLSCIIPDRALKMDLRGGIIGTSTIKIME